MADDDHALIKGNAIPMEPKDGNYGIFAEGARVGSAFPLPGESPEDIANKLKEQNTDG